MAKISALPIVTHLTGDEHIPIVQDRETRSATMSAFRELITPFLQFWYKGDRGDKGDIGLPGDEGAYLADIAELRATKGNGRGFIFVKDRQARFRKLSALLNRREDHGGDYVIDDAGSAWLMEGRVADIRPDLPSLGQLIAQAAQGAALTIGTIGDSTADGALTTGALDNPTSGIDVNWGKIPSATTDHTEEAPNAWPAVLRQILRDHYGNDAIQVWNGGYGGQRCSGDDYWAAHWYSKIFAQNVHYGAAPAVTLIAFGLNDANTASPSMVADYLRGLRALCAAARGAGSVPVVMTPFSVINPNYSFRALRELVAAVRTWCPAQGVDLIDTHDATAKYWAANGRVRMAVEIADYVHPGDQAHGFVAGFVATRLCADIRRVTADAEGIGAFEVWANASVRPPVKNLAADSRYGGWTNTAGFVDIDPIDAFVWIEHGDCHAHMRMFSGVVSGPITEDDLPRIRVTTADGYRLAPATYIDRRLCLGDKGLPYNFVADMPVEIGRLRYGLNRIRVTLPATTKVACQFDSLEFTRSGLPARGYQANANALVHDRRSLRGRGRVDAATHLELPPEMHRIDATSIASFGLSNDRLEAVVRFTGPVDAGVNLLTFFGDGGARTTYGAVKKPDGVYAYVLDTENASCFALGSRPYANGQPDTIELRVFYEMASVTPRIRVFYGDDLLATYTNLGGFAIAPVGRIGGAFSPLDSTALGDVSYSFELLRSTM